jgi:hypothetical protein
MPFYTCPSCKCNSILEEADLVEDGELEDNDVLTDDQDYESDIMAAASSYAEIQTRACIKRIIKEFDKLDILGADLVVLSKMYMVLANLSNYTIDGYLSFTVKTYVDGESMSFHEIHIDEEGLRLTSGISYVEDDELEEHESHISFPFEDEFAALNAFDEIGRFVNDINTSLSEEAREIDAVDSGDTIEDNEIE